MRCFISHDLIGNVCEEWGIRRGGIQIETGPWGGARFGFRGLYVLFEKLADSDCVYQQEVNYYASRKTPVCDSVVYEAFEMRCCFQLRHHT